MGRVKRIWYLSPMRAAKVQASLRIRRQTESQIPGPSEWLGMRSYNLSWRNARRHKFAWCSPYVLRTDYNYSSIINILLICSTGFYRFLDVCNNEEELFSTYCTITMHSIQDQLVTATGTFSFSPVILWFGSVVCFCNEPFVSSNTL